MIGFIIGYIVQQLSIAMYSTIAGFVIASIITLPPWPMYRRHPLHVFFFINYNLITI